MALPVASFPPTAGLAPFYTIPPFTVVFNPNALPGAFILNPNGPPGGFAANPSTPGTHIVNPVASRGTFILNSQAPRGTFIDDPNLLPGRLNPIPNASGAFTVNSSVAPSCFITDPNAPGIPIVNPNASPIPVSIATDLTATFDMTLTPIATWTKAVDKQVDQLLARATKHIEELTKIKEIMTPPKITAGLGQVSAAIYNANPVSQTGILFSEGIPLEIRCLIWGHIQNDADRTALALTCKSLANEFECLKHSKALKDLKDGIVPKSQRATRDHRLMVLIRLLNWMPRGKRLCFSCVRYCPRNKGQWGGDTKYERAAMFHDSNGRNGENCVSKTSFKNTVPRNAVIEGSRCPTCVQRVALETAKTKAGYLNLKIKLHAHGI